MNNICGSKRAASKFTASSSSSSTDENDNTNINGDNDDNDDNEDNDDDNGDGGIHKNENIDTHGQDKYNDLDHTPRKKKLNGEIFCCGAIVDVASESRIIRRNSQGRIATVVSIELVKETATVKYIVSVGTFLSTNIDKSRLSASSLLTTARKLNFGDDNTNPSLLSPSHHDIRLNDSCQ